MSKRQQIVDAIEARLKTIRAGQSVTLCTGTSYTYATSVGAYVQVWRDQPVGADDRTLVIIKDTSDAVDADEAVIGYQMHSLQIELSLIYQDDDAAEFARKALADLCACIGADPSWSLANCSSRLESVDLDSDTSTKEIASGQVVFAVEYEASAWQI